MSKIKKFFKIDYFLDGKNSKIPYPNHCVVIGATQTGKSSLIAKIFDKIEEVYSVSEKIKEKKLIIISPINRLEIYSLMLSKNEWEMSLFSSQNFSKQLMLEIEEQFNNSSADLKILLIDDFLIRAAKQSKYLAILNQIFAYYRHLGISIFATMHSFDPVFNDLIQQAGMLITLFSPNLVSILRTILRRYYYLGTAEVVRGIYDCYIRNMKAHDYLVIYNCKEALSGDIFYLTNNIFNPKTGLTSKQFLIF